MAMIDVITSFDLIRSEAAKATLRHKKPTFEEDKYISDACTYVLVKHPFFAHLLYSQARICYTDAVPFAATDSYHIYVNVPGMIAAGMGIAEAAFVLVHEVCHIIFGDLILMVKFTEDGYVWVNANKKLPYDARIMNMAEDYRINAMLIHNGIGKMPSVGLYDWNISRRGDETGVEIYEKIYKSGGGPKPPWPGNCPTGGGSGSQPGQPINDPSGDPGGSDAKQPTQPQLDPNDPNLQGHGGFDVHLKPDQKAKDAEASGQRDQAIAAAANAAIAAGQGDLPACIMRILGEILTPKVCWEDHLKSTVNRACGEPALDWTRQDRRLLQRPDPMYFARPGFNGAQCVAVGWDTSGSTHGLVDAFFAEMAGIVGDLNPLQLVVIRCDAAVHGYDELEEPQDLEGFREAINEEGVGGGGGSDMRPIFRKLEEMDIVPDVLVVLTDLMAALPDRDPGYPVVWASTSKGIPAPFGELVEIDLDE